MKDIHSIKIIEEAFQEHLDSLDQINNFKFHGDILKISKMLIKIVKDNKNIFICGNGGSAADSQHFAAEMTGRFEINRRPLNTIALTTDTSAITAIANDFLFEDIFLRQLQALSKKKDVLICISTSGNSKNLIKAIKWANIEGIITISLTGGGGGKIKKISKFNINIPIKKTSRIQEMHIFILHMLAKLVESSLSKKSI
jgi:D-sedoheptulose 7-phosphate isomerase